MTAPAVEIHDVWKRYASHTAVHDFSLSIPAGSIYGLLGPNGAGKTTLIRMILNIIAPDSGAITVFGAPTRTPNLTDRIGYLPEERGLYRKMQVRRVLRFLAELKGVAPKEADHRITWWLERLGLRTPARDWGSAKVLELSRGMQQKVQFIGAMLHDPDLIILDEPFSGLDAVNALLLQEVITEFRQRGKTVIFSTHILANAESMCDHVCIIANGRKLLDGTVSDVKTRYGAPPVERTVLIQPSLHDIFIEQVRAASQASGSLHHSAE